MYRREQVLSSKFPKIGLEEGKTNFQVAVKISCGVLWIAQKRASRENRSHPWTAILSVVFQTKLSPKIKIWKFLEVFSAQIGGLGEAEDNWKCQTSNWSYWKSDTTRWSSTPKNNNEKKFLNSRIYQKMLFFDLKNSNWGAVCWRPLWPKFIFFVINRFSELKTRLQK